jgi:hypothetical protein
MKMRFMLVSPLIVIALLGCGIIQRIGGPKYDALSVSSDEPIYVWNLNRYSLLLHSGQASENPTAIMAEEGDLVCIQINEIELYYRYNPKDGKKLSFTYDPDAPYKTFLNGRLISLNICDDPSVWEWIKDSDVRSLRHLRSLHFVEDEQGSLDLGLVQKLANALPNIGLILDETYDPVEFLALFTPSWLVVQGLLDGDEDTMSRLKTLECLFCCTSEGTDFVEELPNLENLLLYTEDCTNVLRFDGLTKLRSLSLFGYSEISGLTTISNRKRLRNLYLIGGEPDDFSPISVFPNLTGLGFNVYGGAVDLSELQTLPRLRWFSFPPEVSQNEFSTFLSQHLQLKVIDLIGCDEINDLSPLARLTEIQGLTLDVAVDDLSTLYQLTDMEVLTLVEDSVDEGEYETLQAALPDTQISIGGYCLGSGWILVMIPIIVAASLTIHLRGKRCSR